MAGGRGPVILVGNLTYYQIKVKAGLFNGQAKVDRLSHEQRAFVGLLTQPREPRWIQPNGNEQELESLQELLDTAPGWFALARKMLERGDGKSSEALPRRAVASRREKNPVREDFCG